VFALDAWLRPAPAPAANTRIVVAEARIRSLAQNFQWTWQRPPTREELQGLVESHIREEVLYREALALGLDRDDAIIRRRMRQKMEFVSEEAAALAEPSDAELDTYLRAHPDAFAIEPRVSFQQVFLDPRKHPRTLESDAKRLIDRLNAPGATPDLGRLGDALMLLEPRYEAATRHEIERLFGREFADAIVRQPPGAWPGPVASGFGVHVVKVDALEPGGTPALADVRPLVEREWKNAKRQELAKAFYERLRARYSVNVKWPGATKADGPKP
jgi:hypothetical protein